ncbi:ribosome-binding factor A [Candidatus Kaiserbacteria bacterium]|nr:ribosome-binding factor A [Candidatus Kaiserbacteria bacterium]
MSKKDDRLASALHTAAAEFINRESNRRSLITVTRVEWPEGERGARVFISVFPQKNTHAAMDFLTRQHDAFMAFLKKSVKLHVLPYVTFLPDPEMGSVEKN